MCGICGKFNFGNDAPAVETSDLRRMLDPIAHRGPDAEGLYRSGPVGLGHKRLKIIDLTTGQQPMCNEDGTVWVVYNGEVYNYKELTDFLVARGHSFKTTSDTEVIVHLYEELGEDCVSQLRGMFAFALWDDRNKTLLLARDRVGIKPLYYHHTGKALLFGSEIKAILADPASMAEIDPKIIHQFLTYFYVPGTGTIFKQIKKLLPGHYLTAKGSELKVKRYWDLSFKKVRRSFPEAVEELENLLARTVRDHMISDVPVGVLLSGGVDSSAVLSYAVENNQQPISTFTVGFDGAELDERPYARLAAQRFGARNYEITISDQDFWDFLPRYVWHMEEPVCEPPAVALYYVSKLARQYVTVLLSGEGGDEAFAGYQSYRNFTHVEGAKGWLGPLAGPAGSLITRFTRRKGVSKFGKYGKLMGTPLAQYYYSHSSGPYEFFNRESCDFYTADFFAAVHNSHPAEFTQQCFATVSDHTALDQMLYVDTKTWLPDDLLIKADKITMANSLELRVPLLDHQVLEFAASLPAEYKLRNTTTKHILKTALGRRLPPEILYRKKAGFPIPYSKWLRSSLRDRVAAVLLDSATMERGYFKKSGLERMIYDDAHDRSKELFSLVVLELWHRTFLSTHVEAPCC